MAVTVEDLCSNLNKLLNDICKFLSDEVNYEQLSPLARKQAEELINRSKEQLLNITRVSLDNNGAYVDMEKRPSNAETDEDDTNAIYSAVDESTIVRCATPVVEIPINPYANLPAKDVSQEIKYGYLTWRYKIILKFEKNRRVYAGLHNNWMLVYSSEKDCKPLQAFNLKFHKAQIVANKQKKNPPQDFELVCTLGEGKTYYFLTSTHKDVQQWISHINKCHNNLNTCEEPPLSDSDDDISQTYDTILEPISIKNDKKNDIETNDFSQNKPPDLPARGRIKTNVPLPPTPLKENASSESLPKDDAQSTPSLNSSFSTDGESDDCIYEAFVQPQAVVTKPAILKEKPKICPKLRK
ncbi:uncharacterized protein blow [Tribolium castaneum]|uniref:PH domain-containing protein n=1 Tax=Tribolium castaneum TaxID=7070 RepID=D6W787_TRICA|nr:PREDICTED: uncharacterized protein LOC662221 [Tribolium castaneum]EFA11527.2 hypothetical protein TcasGA2_TC014242 [Tribolium castaneum]|eukprot:XP_008193502.1 PREDICTED: uncharacterized protein LOC662221 [Tribolium castaneum]